MSYTLEILCGEPDRNNKSRVIAKLNGKQVVHRFDVLDSWQRRKFREQVIEDFQFDDNAHEAIEQKLLAAADDDKPKNTGPRFKCYTAPELDLLEFPENYLVNGILSGNEPMVVGGPEKSLKTSIMLQMGVALTAPDRFLGVFDVPERKRFLMLSGESGLKIIQETIRRQLRAIGLEPSQVPELIVSSDLPQLDKLDDVFEFEALIEEHTPDVVAVDPMMLCLGDIDERAANMFAMGKLLRRLNEACVKHGATLIFAHHTSGNHPYGETPKLNWLAFAGFKQFVRQWILLHRTEEYEPGSGFHRLKMVAGGSAGHNGLWIVEINEGTRETPGGRFWECEVRCESEVRQQRQRERAEADEQKFRKERWSVIEVLRKYPEGLSKTRMLNKANIRTGRHNIVYETLVEAGDIIECDITTGNHKKPQPGCKLAGNIED